MNESRKDEAGAVETHSTKDLTTRPDFQVEIAHGYRALHEIKLLVRHRPDPVIINGKRYLEFCDWQILGTFFGASAYITHTEEITKERPSESGKFVFIDIVGYKAHAAVRDMQGHLLSEAEAICTRDEKNWQKSEGFQMLSMAQTRAMAKALRAKFGWVMKLQEPNAVPEKYDGFGDEAAEEVIGNGYA